MWKGGRRNAQGGQKNQQWGTENHSEAHRALEEREVAMHLTSFRVWLVGWSVG